MKIFLKNLIVLIVILSCNKNVDPKYSPTFSETKKLDSLKKEIIFAPHPLHNPVRLQIMYGPIIDILNKNIHEAHFSLEASKDYAEYNEKIKTKSIDILLPNPLQTVMAQKFGYKVFGKLDDDENFRGVIIVRKNENINKITELKNKTIAFPAPTAIAATLMPQLYINQNGLKLKNSSIKSLFVGTQESAIIAVDKKEVDAAGVWLVTWDSYTKEKKDLKDRLKILGTTPKLISLSLMSKKDLDPVILEKVKQVFFSLDNTPEGRGILAKMSFNKFVPADDRQYSVVNEFISIYKKEIGELP